MSDLDIIRDALEDAGYDGPAADAALDRLVAERDRASELLAGSRGRYQAEYDSHKETYRSLFEVLGERDELKTLREIEHTRYLASVERLKAAELALDAAMTKLGNLSRLAADEIERNPALGIPGYRKGLLARAALAATEDTP